MILRLSWKSLKNRKLTAGLCIFSIALSVMLFLSVERMRAGAEEGFTNTISQTDLVVGARSGQLQLLLYAVFHMGSPTNNIRYSSYEKIISSPAVAWSIPVSLGDSYRGFRVVATDQNFYKHYTFRGDRKIIFQDGAPAEGLFDVVVGAEVAARLGHKVGQKIVLSHGVSEVAVLEHKHSPFHIVGVLAPTQTPVDRGVYITLEGMEAMHIGWETGSPSYGDMPDYETMKKEDIKIGQLTAFLLRNQSRIFTLKMQRMVQDFEDEPLMAIIPGLALQELWQNLSYLENVLKIISASVLLVGFLSVVIALYTSLNERRREMAILRSVGLGAGGILCMLLLESEIGRAHV